MVRRFVVCVAAVGACAAALFLWADARVSAVGARVALGGASSTPREQAGPNTPHERAGPASEIRWGLPNRSRMWQVLLSRGILEREGEVREMLLRKARWEAECLCWATSKEPKATIISVLSGISAAYVGALRANRALEAHAFGYEYCEFNSKGGKNETLPPAWGKVRAIQELMRRGRRVLVWMDADAFFTTLKSFENVTQAYFDAGKDIIFTTDHRNSGSPVNSGVFVMRSTPWSEAFWRSLYDDFPELLLPICMKWGCFEQKAIAAYQSLHRRDFADHVAIIPYPAMNNVASIKGEFIAHIAGVNNKNHRVHKYEYILKYVAQANSAIAAASPRQGGAFDDESATARFRAGPGDSRAAT